VSAQPPTWAPLAAEARYSPEQRPSGRRRELLERVRPGGLVLDVGCWSGFNAAFLAEECGAVVDGVEPDAKMAVAAEQHCREVLRSGIEEALTGLLARPERYDAVLFLDVLEHLADPHTVLREARGLLRDGGVALVSLPNVAHWSMRLGLLRGRWRYAESGLLDRTHLRFFTTATATELFSEAGWSIRWRAASVGQPPVLSLPERRLGLLERWPEMFAVQLLYELTP
jgi:2-polyprenyl-3-methyl-5-hydroxy-6-metoxy-1,4-benzoquinol methylase